MTPPRFTVVGTGRCGTGYVAELLRAAGLNCGHEHWWTPVTARRRPGLDGDSSWMALPDIETGAWSGPVVHVVRHPVAVVRSLLGVGLFSRDRAHPDYASFALAHEPELTDMRELAACVEWWARWNARCATVADVTVRVEDLPDRFPAVAEAIGCPLTPSRDVPTTVNHRRRRSADEATVWRLLNGRATRFGYDEGDACG